MNRVTDHKVRDFILHELPLVTTIFLRRVNIDDDAVLQDLFEIEDIAEMADAFFHHFRISAEGFSVGNYYPWQGKSPLTIRMFIESARSGRWLYK
ncbi:TPA: DUF1493 family protein [Escherichia coli]|uniref:DUF1493 family protein n=1 Tax=Escherichia coli TaxID=562 RepID=UPI000B7FE963|nr:DUF1493 family protein [Escherichia coli]EKK4596440.1 DUF1493 family protein [Escherichia coli]KAE9686813.1 DUF1493 family protein [Escherichia coli]MBB7985397.1 DUF1493 family protein [Escherichia coli]HBI7867373.1 DUF1493 family protein [Escherichia coli]HDX6773920.1 DUF1493 family protein [Escherichia coli]